MLSRTDPKRAPLSVKRNMVWNSVGSFGNLLCAWLITVFVMRLSATYDAPGVYSYVVSVYAIFSSLVDYRLYMYQIGDLHGENSLGEYFALRLITSGIALVLIAAYSLATSAPDLLIPILLYSLYKIAGTILDCFHALEQREKRMDYIGISYAIQGVVSLVAFVAVFAAAQNLSLTLFAMFVATVIVGIIYDLPRVRYFEEFKPRISAAKARELLVRCAPAVLAFMAISGATSIPRQYLMNAQGEAALGVYGTMVAPVAIVQTGAGFVYNPLLTYFKEIYERRDRRSFIKLMGLTLLAIVVIGILCLIGVQLLGAFLYGLIYGDRILEYLYLLPPMVIAALAIAYMGFLNSLETVFYDFKSTFVGGVVALAAALVTMVPLVNVFGLNGVTYCSIISSLASTLVMLGFLAHELKGHFASGDSLTHLEAGPSETPSESEAPLHPKDCSSQEDCGSKAAKSSKECEEPIER